MIMSKTLEIVHKLRHRYNNAMFTDYAENADEFVELGNEFEKPTNKPICGAIVKLNGGALSLRVTATVLGQTVLLHRAFICEPFNGSDVLNKLSIENRNSVKSDILAGRYTYAIQHEAMEVAV